MVFDKVKELIVDTLSCDEGELKMETSLVDDLGADSLDAVELIMALEDEFGIKIDEADHDKFKTIGSIVEYIESANI